MFRNRSSAAPVHRITRFFDFRYLVVFVMAAAAFTACKHKTSAGDTGGNTNPKELALLYLSENKLDEAEASFARAVQLDPNDISSYFGLARLYMLQKNYDAAESEVNAALKIKPDNTDLKLILAEAWSKTGKKEQAVNELKEILKQEPKNVKAYYALAGLASSPAEEAERKALLLKVMNLAPANIVPRLDLAELYASEGKTDSSMFLMQSVKKIAADFSAPAGDAYQKAMASLQANQPVQSLPYIRQFHQLVKINPAYSTGSDDVNIPMMIAGYSQFTTSIGGQSAGAGESGQPGGLKFTDATPATGLSAAAVSNASASALAVAARDGVGNLFVYGSFREGTSGEKHYLLISKLGGFQECSVNGGIDHDGQDLYAAFADYDNDGFEDLFVVTTKGTLIYRNQGDGTFSKVTDKTGIAATPAATKVLFADFDQDGDIDMYVAQKGANKFFRNNGDGTFTENAAAMGLAGSPAGTLDMDFADYDEDGDPDIAAVKGDGGLQLLNNNRHGDFTDATSAAGLQNPAYNGSAIAFGDYNNDGMPDLLVAGGKNGQCSLLKNTGHGFVSDPASKMLSSALKGIKVYDAVFFDYDNDGHLDLLVAGVNENGSGSGVKLFHNDGAKGFSDASKLLPETVKSAYHIKINDFDLDGDEDIFLSGPSGLQLIRNDGGNANNYIQVQLVGLSYGNSKNNRLGIGSQIELKAGDLYQVKTVTGPTTEFGVGSHSKLDAVRIIWTNGVPQTILDPEKKERVLEQEQLKGSCPFLFTWNGKKYQFIKDMMWRSALGMPVAVKGTDTTRAYFGPSKEYLMIPGEELQPKDGIYSIKITEELWEAIFFDKVSLMAVDHPDSVSTYTDERFVPPPYPGLKLYPVTNQYLPVSATDGKGNNVLPKLQHYDFQYVDNFSMGKFQGVAQEHDLVLDLGGKAKADSVTLFLRGWIFPTDASVNTALTQSSKYPVNPPSLQVMNKKGEWQTVIPNMGFPMGRDKMVVASLTGKFLTPNDRRVRIRTNMQIYWDQAFFATGSAKAPVNIEPMKMNDASLAYRGYSATYRKGGPYGPIWLDYYNTTRGQKWRDLTGYYTRYGDVLPLLQRADDEYVICNAGDVMTMSFDAAQLRPLPKGWKRDFLIYSEGWVKDGDMNTSYGQTVAPLPFHAMPGYPYGGSVKYPDDAAHREYLRKYDTRKVNTERFRDALRLSK